MWKTVLLGREGEIINLSGFAKVLYKYLLIVGGVVCFISNAGIGRKPQGRNFS